MSQAFCSFIGYEEKELIGKPIDEATAFRTANIPQHLGAVVHFENFHNLWMFVGRTEHEIVLRSDWELFPDSTMVIFCQPD